MGGATWERILTGLEAKGWVWKDDYLHAPNGSMWLGREAWDDSFEQFSERMHRRRDRIQRNHGAWEGEERAFAAEALSDVAILVEVLRGLAA